MQKNKVKPFSKADIVDARFLGGTVKMIRIETLTELLRAVVEEIDKSVEKEHKEYEKYDNQIAKERIKYFVFGFIASKGILKKYFGELIE